MSERTGLRYGELSQYKEGKLDGLKTVYDEDGTLAKRVRRVKSQEPL